VQSHGERDSDLEVPLDVESDMVHLVLTRLELDIIVDALRSVGNLELAEDLDTILRHTGPRADHDQGPFDE
jgi:hypothetical protein